MNLTHPLLVLDLETTGIWVEKDKIIEIAMIKRDVDGKEESFVKRVNPGIPIPAAVTKITGISDADVHDAPAFKDIAADVLKFIGECDITGFNVQRFDLPLLERECSDAGLKFEWQKHKVLDVQKVYHLNEKRDLTAAYQFYCQKDLTDAHSALSDAQATFEILNAQIEKYGKGDGTIEDLRAFEYKDMAEFYDEGRKFRWWNGKLYIMFGKHARKYNIQELVRKDRNYLEWILSADFSEDVKTLITDALNGKFPSPPQQKQKVSS